MPDTTDLYTTVINTSGKTMSFSYLGKHGKSLASLGTFTVWGHIQHSFGHGEVADRKRRALEADLLAGRLTLKSTPRPLLYDASGDAQVANPTTQATATATGGGASGGALPAGTYYIAYTWVNSWGETTIGTSRSAQLTVGATNIPRVTIPALPTNATSANIYVTDTGGASGTEKLYKTGVTTTTTDLALATYDGGAYAAADDPPTSNTTKAATIRGLTVADNTLGATDPSWGRYTG